jgi:AraC-like DNA-binding protein
MDGVAFVPGRPHPALRAALGDYIGYVERNAEPLVRREAAGARCVFIVGWGDPIDVADPRRPWRSPDQLVSFTGGLSASYVDTTNVGTGQGVQLMLPPLTAARLLRMPVGELTDRVVRLDQLGHDAGDLAALPERLAEAPDWPARFAILDRVLGRRLVDAPDADPRLERVWACLVATHGRAPVELLAAEVGWSRRHLAAVCRRQLGLPPKTIARLLRFERARSQAARAARDGWAAVAADCGYYDQAHLIRDFREFTGSTPTAFPFVQARTAAAPAR